MDSNPKSQVIDRVKEAQNVLISVSTNPSIDQLSAALGLTLMMNSLGKHATAVFSGEIPSVIEFLKPEDTLEKNTDSLRDFIISLDKSKADKLRYKVEEDVVKIFITPYKTSLSDKDLEFSQGDFNVDVVLALGVDQKDHLDQAITAHGRILHDATVISIMAGNLASDVGSINWQDQNASSLSEMVAGMSESFGSNLIDAQMATAFLTGIVAETERFSNEKTSPKVMTMSAQLMAAGANQQLIAIQLEPEVPEEVPEDLPEPQTENQPAAEQATEPESNQNEGEISLHDMPEKQELNEPDLPEIPEDLIRIDDQGTLKTERELAEAVSIVQANSEIAKNESTPEDSKNDSSKKADFSKYMQTPPSNYSTFTSSSNDGEQPSIDPLSMIPSSGPIAPEADASSPLLGVQDDAESVKATEISTTPSPMLPSDGEDQNNMPLGPEIEPGDTLADIEKAVEDFHDQDTNSAREAVDAAIGSGDGFNPDRPEPIQALGAKEFTPDESPPAVPPPLIPPFPLPEEANKES